MLPDLITVEPYLGPGAYGPAYGTGVQLRARLEGRRRMVRTATGVDVIGSAVATVRPEATVPVESRVTYGANTFEVLDVVIGKGLRRPSHLELILGGPR